MKPDYLIPRCLKCSSPLPKHPAYVERVVTGIYFNSKGQSFEHRSKLLVFACVYCGAANKS